MEKAIREILRRIEDRILPEDSMVERIADVLECRPVAPVPLIPYRPRNAAAPGHTFSLKEQFFDPERMLYAHLEEMEDCYSGHSGAPLTLRPNFGTILMPAAFGLDYEVFEDQYPWLTSHADPVAIERLEDTDILASPIIKRAIEYIKCFKSLLPAWIHVYMPDTQGIFDLAHMLIGDEVFYLLYDDPDAVHRLMRLCVNAYCNVTDHLKQALGEKPHCQYHGHALPYGIYMRNGGVRISEDSAILLSPEHIDEFVIPYIDETLSSYQGGFVHYCGHNLHMLTRLTELSSLRAVNLGNPEMYDFHKVMCQCHQNNCVYFGHWHSLPGEGVDRYLRRIWDASDAGTRGLLLHFDISNFKGISWAQVQDLWNNGFACA